MDRLVLYLLNRLSLLSEEELKEVDFNKGLLSLDEDGELTPEERPRSSRYFPDV